MTLQAAKDPAFILAKKFRGLCGPWEGAPEVSPGLSQGHSCSGLYSSNRKELLNSGNGKERESCELEGGLVYLSGGRGHWVITEHMFCPLLQGLSLPSRQEFFI